MFSTHQVSQKKMTEQGKQRVSEANTGWLQRRIDWEIKLFCEKLATIKLHKGQEAMNEYIAARFDKRTVGTSH